MLIRRSDRIALLIAILVNLTAFVYLITSAVVVINAFVWLSTLPAFWYDIQHIIYWPWQPYFDLAYALLGRSSISYGAYAVVTRTPFLLVPIAIMGLTVRRLCSGVFHRAPARPQGLKGGATMG